MPGIGRQLVLATAVLLGTAPGWAQTDVIKARRDNFRDLSSQMREILKGLGNGVPVSALQMPVAAADAALRRVPDLFPAGSGDGRTKALPAVWSEPERFTAALADAQTRMDALVAATGGSDRDAFGAAVGRLTAACGACHAEFRAAP